MKPLLQKHIEGARKTWQRFLFAWHYAYDTDKWQSFRKLKSLKDPFASDNKIIFDDDLIAIKPARNYCRKHNGIVGVGDEIKEWAEECDCKVGKKAGVK
jgi:hypothetical protein